MLPALCFTPLPIAWGLALSAPPTRRKIALVLILAAIVFQFLPLVPRSKPPYLQLDWTARRSIRTHDGIRCWGGYLLTYSRMRKHRSPPTVAAEVLLKKLEASSKSYVLMGKPVPRGTVGTLFGFLPSRIAEKGGDLSIHREWIRGDRDGHRVLIVSDAGRELPGFQAELAGNDWVPIRTPIDVYGRTASNWLPFVQALEL